MPLNPGAINQILPFAYNGTVADGDLISLEKYSTDEIRTYGHQGGVNARREIENRALRQATFVAAGLAQWIANRSSSGVIDNSDLDALENSISTALTSIGINLATESSAGLVRIGKEVRKSITSSPILFYIRKDGNDTRSGLSESNSIRTIDRMQQILWDTDFRNVDVVINIGAGEWMSTKWDLNSCNAKSISFIGNSSDSTVFIDGSSPNQNTAGLEFKHSSQMKITISKIGFSSLISGHNIKISDYADVILGSDIKFHKASVSHILVENHSNLEIWDDYSITGISPTHLKIDNFSSIKYRKIQNNMIQDINIAISSAPTFSNAFVHVLNHSSLKYDSICGYNGTTYGKRYLVDLMSLICTSGAGANFLPGNLAGIEQNGGKYI